MRLTINHETIYQFDEPVFFEPHFLHFKPAYDTYLFVNDFQLSVSPAPTGLSEHMDTENNIVHFCWFDDLHDTLKVTSQCTVTVKPFNPFNYLIYPETYLTIPFEYPGQVRDLLRPSLQCAAPGAEIMKYLDDLLQIAERDTSTFIMQLTRRIHQQFNVESRDEGEPYSPETTFGLKSGSCRDLTWMQIHFLRNLGIAARFVSGYYYLDAAEPAFELHAWLEAYLPGAGWVGYDPSHGIAVGHTHIPVARSAHYENTMPVIGTVRGNGKANLRFSLNIELDQ